MSKEVILCDVDGTLADVNHRLHYIKNDDDTLKPYAERDWDSFNEACAEDRPNEDVIEILNSLRLAAPWGRWTYDEATPRERDVYFLSGRNEVVRGTTVAWLQKYVLPDSSKLAITASLWMRKADDRRPDTEIKLEMVRELGFTPDDVLCILDDRQCVVDMWR